MKRKVLAMMMSLTLAMAVTACGGSDTETDAADTAVEETVDDTAEADEAEAEDVAAEDATEETEEDLGPLYSIEAAVAPDVGKLQSECSVWSRPWCCEIIWLISG